MTRPRSTVLVTRPRLTVLATRPRATTPVHGLSGTGRIGLVRFSKATYRWSRTPAHLQHGTDNRPAWILTDRDGSHQDASSACALLPEGRSEARVLATFDISNTRIKAGIFDGPDPVADPKSTHA